MKHAMRPPPRHPVLLGLLFTAAMVCGMPFVRAEPVPSPDVQQEQTFNIMEYQIEGNTKLPELEIEKAVYPFLGEGRTIKDIDGAREALEKVYHDSGYLTALVSIPEQRVAEGTVLLVVTESPVGKLRVAGARYYSLGYLKAHMPSVEEGSVPDFGEVQKDLAQANQEPGRHVTPVLKPSATPGKVDVELKVADEPPWGGSVQLDNRFGPGTTQLRATGILHYDNLWQRGHSISFQYQIAPERPDDARVASLSYVWRMAGLTWAAYAVKSESDVATVGDINVIGNGDIFGLRAIKPLPGTESLFHQLTAGFDYKHFKQDILLGADTDRSPVTYMPFTLQYSGTLTDGWGQTTLEAGANMLVRGLVNNRDEFVARRAGAQTNYFVFRGALQRLQKLPFKWSLMARFEGQLTDTPLISNEQFSAGGAESVRGYEESERLGDDGMRAMLEARSPTLWGDGQSRTVYVLFFGEGAQLRVREALPSQESKYTLASAGLGLRMKGWWGLSLDMDAARALTDGANTRAGDQRVLFKGLYEF